MHTHTRARARTHARTHTHTQTNIILIFYIFHSKTDSEENSTIDVQEKWQPLFTSCVSGLDQILDRKLDKTTPSPCNQERHASESPELKVKLTLPKHRTAKSFSAHNGDNGHEQPPPPPTLRPVLPFLDVQAEIKSHQSIEDVS